MCAIIESMKKCSGCKELKSVEDFNKKSASKDGLQPYCRQCSKLNYKARYDSLPEEKIRLRKSNESRRDVIREALRKAKDFPCTDCGVKYPYYVMDLDHLGDKEFNVSRAVSSNMKL